MVSTRTRHCSEYSRLPQQEVMSAIANVCALVGRSQWKPLLVTGLSSLNCHYQTTIVHLPPPLQTKRRQFSALRGIGDLGLCFVYIKQII